MENPDTDPDYPLEPTEPPAPNQFDAPLDHDEIEAANVIERYHRGALSAAEEARFEAHFLDCARCQEELEVQRSFERGLHTVAAQEAARAVVQASVLRAGLLGWLGRYRPWLSTAAVLVLGLALLFSWSVNQSLRQQLATTPPGSESPPSGLLQAPLVQIPTTLLGVMRGDEAAAGEPIVDAGTPWSLAIDAGSDLRIQSYRVRILDAEGTARFELDDLQPNVLEVIQLTFPSGFLPTGDYRLTVTGNLPDGGTVDVGSYPFRLQTPS